MFIKGGYPVEVFDAGSGKFPMLLQSSHFTFS